MRMLGNASVILAFLLLMFFFKVNCLAAEETYLTEEIQEECYQIGHEFHILPELLMAMIERESSGRHDVIGSDKYVGLMQLNMYTFGGDGIDLTDIHTNIYLGAEYLAGLCETYGDTADALDAYSGNDPTNESNSKYSIWILTRAEELEILHEEKEVKERVKLYNILQEIMNCFDEDGCITDIDRLDALNLELSKKIEYVGKHYKNIEAEYEACKTQKEYFDQRMKVLKNQMESAKRYLNMALNGEKYHSEDMAVSISFRRSQKVEVCNMDALLSSDHEGRFTKYAAPEPRKDEIKKAIQNGEMVPGCEIVEGLSTIIK